jgi:hypothetical protein
MSNCYPAQEIQVEEAMKNLKGQAKEFANSIKEAIDVDKRRINDYNRDIEELAGIDSEELIDEDWQELKRLYPARNTAE